MSFAENPYILIQLIAAFANLGIGIYVFLGKPRDPAHQAFFVLVAGGFLWIAGLVALSVTHIFFLDIVINYGALLLFLGGLRFVTLFPEPLKLPVRPLLLYAPLLIAAVGIIPQHRIVSGITVLPNGGFEPILGPLLPVWTAIIFSYALLSIGILIYKYHKADGYVRMQLKYLILGLSVFLLSVVIFDTFLPAAFGITSLNGVGPLSSVAFVGLSAYAIVRHKLLDIRVVIQRGIIYSVLLALIVSFYIALAGLMSVALGSASHSALFVSALVTAVAGIFGTPVIDRLLRQATDRIFFKGRYDYAEALSALSKLLYSATTFEDFVDKIESYLAATLRAHSVRVLLASKGEAVCDTSTAREGGRMFTITVPILLEDTPIGCIDAGPKRSGDPYSSQDLQLLTTIAYQVATSLSRVQLYRQVEQHAHDLERKVQERTEELSKAREQERQTMMDISHNLQTPLTILQTKLDSLTPEIREDPEVRSFGNSLQGLSGFIYDLLSLAQIGSSQAPAKTRVDLSEVVSEVAEEIGTIADARGIAVTTSIRPDIYVNGDRKRLREAVMNLASNSLKYMRPEHPRTIGFSLESEYRDAVLAVSDTGIGISPDDLPHIFDQFYRSKDAPGDIRGTGLGLAIVKRIIEQDGGTVTVASEPGSGTRLTISLPLA